MNSFKNKVVVSLFIFTAFFSNQRVDATFTFSVEILLRVLCDEYKKTHSILTPEQQDTAYREVAWQALGYVPYLNISSPAEARRLSDLFVYMAKNGPHVPLAFPSPSPRSSEPVGSQLMGEALGPSSSFQAQDWQDLAMDLLMDLAEKGLAIQ